MNRSFQENILPVSMTGKLREADILVIDRVWVVSGQAGFKAKEQEADVQNALPRQGTAPTDGADGFQPIDGFVILYDVVEPPAAGRAEEF